MLYFQMNSKKKFAEQTILVYKGYICSLNDITITQV